MDCRDAKDCPVKEDVTDIKVDIREIKENLGEHMARTAASEARLELMEQFVMKQSETNANMVDKVIAQSNSNQKALNSQFKISITIFTAVATLITALAAWLSKGV